MQMNILNHETILSIFIQVLHAENITFVPDMRDSLYGPRRLLSLVENRTTCSVSQLPHNTLVQA